MVKKEHKNTISEDDGDILGHNKGVKRSADESAEEPTKKIKTKSYYRQPTVNELNRLHETESLFNSNLFRLQVEEILQEVKVKEKTENRFQQWFESFKKHLDSIPEQDTEYDLSENKFYKEIKIKNPLQKNISKTKCIFKFKKFENVLITGSYALNNVINSKLVVDIQLMVPAEVYTKNDSINYRYHKKRAAYLSYVASHLKKSELCDDINFNWLNGCEYMPILSIKPNGKLGNHITIKLHLSCDPETYKLHRFSLSRNNLRENWLFESGDNIEIGPPTPFYNSSILQELTASTSNELLKETLLKGNNLKQAIVLLKIWMHQRGLRVSGFVISMYVAYLVQLKRINNVMSSYQIVRNVWIALKSSTWDTEGISLNSSKNSKTPTPSLQEFKDHFPVVFLDKTGYYNICWRMSQGTYDALKRESMIAIDLLDNTKINSFIPLFMTHYKSLIRFDHILRFKNVQELKQKVVNATSNTIKLNYGLDELSLTADSIHSLLVQGLGDRVVLVQDIVGEDFSWSVKESVDKAMMNHDEKLSFGIILDIEKSMSTVLKGPPANLPEAEVFRSFWGDKSELRRFQDGSILETCVWEGDSLSDRRMISKQIVTYLLMHKYSIPATSLFYIADQLDSVITCKQFAPPTGVIGTGEELSVKVIQVLDQLRKDLTDLSQLPLEISSVFGTSPVFSYTSPYPPIPYATQSTRILNPGTVPPYTPVSHVVLELTHSGKWPGELQAFRCLKAAFHLQIADRIHKQYSLHTRPHPAHVDVFKAGLVFRLQIAHGKEVTLLKRVEENGVVKHRDSEESLALVRNTVLMPRLRVALHGLHQRYPIYGPTVCLFKRWLSSHLLDDYHFSGTSVELLIAHCIVNTSALSVPCSCIALFLKALKVLVETDWDNEMVVVDFTGEMKAEELTSLSAQYSSRSRSGPPSMTILTSYDGDHPGMWTRSSPSPLVLTRTRKLADLTLTLVEKGLELDMKDNLMHIFIPSLKGYDVLIHLRPELVPYVSERVDKTPRLVRVSETGRDDVIPAVEFNAVQLYLEELRSAYSEFALFFHDSFGGEIIAVLWKPNVDDVKEFQVLSAHALKQVKVKGETKYKTNKDAIVEDFRKLGEGLVKDITVCS